MLFVALTKVLLHAGAEADNAAMDFLAVVLR